jgi:hypothetical protein
MRHQVLLRRVLVLHVISSEAQYAPGHLGDYTGRVYSRYKHLDENFFPVPWSKDGYRTPGIDEIIRS